jgi:Tfp pilus assembly protein PilF
MNRNLFVRVFGPCMASSLVLLAGCQLFDTRPAPPSLASKENTPKLNAKQVADVQIAFAQSVEDGNESPGAESAYREALKADPNRADALVRLATLRDKTGKFEESSQLYRKALALKPGNADIFCNMGYSQYLQRHWAEAEMNLKQAIAIKHDHRQAHNNLGLVLAQTDRPAEALAEFRRAGCTEADAHNNLAFGLTLQGRWDAARAEYAAAIQLDPSLNSARKALTQISAIAAKAGKREELAGGPLPATLPEPIPGTFVSMAQNPAP